MNEGVFGLLLGALLSFFFEDAIMYFYAGISCLLSAGVFVLKVTHLFIVY